MATAGARVSVKLVPCQVRQLTIFDLLPLFVAQIDAWIALPGLAGTRAVIVIFSTITHEQATRQDIRLDDQIHGRVVVLDTGDGGMFGTIGINEPAVYEDNPCAREERELSASRGGAEHGGRSEDGVEIHAL